MLNIDGAKKLSVMRTRNRPAQGGCCWSVTNGNSWGLGPRTAELGEV